jgi:apoptosis-inducing factor 2
MADKKTVVIIGGSYGGLTAAKTLASTHSVVLIDKRDYFDMNFAAPRLLQNPELATTIVKKLTDFPWMSQVTLKQAAVVELHPDHVVLSTGDTVKFDFCIIASGT